jgi:hypothetical protein
VPFAFTTDRHLAATAGDLVLTTLEAAAESRYALAHRGPAAQLLVDYTLAANTQDHPAVMNAVLAGRYGSSCRADYQPKPSQVTACKAVH